MTALPAATPVVVPGPAGSTQGQVQTWITAMHDWAAGLFGTDGTIATALTTLAAASIASLQTQAATAFTTAGTAPSYTLTPSPALASYVAGQRFRVKFHAAPAGSDTLNVSGLGAKTLKQYDSTGAKIAAVLASGMLCDIEYDGTDMVVLDPLPAAAASSVPTGVVEDYVGLSAPSGYVMLSGRTIGDASSSATERANADTAALFTLLWNSLADAQAPVSGGRGANAAADYAAHKRITLPDARGRVIAGLDNMGGTTASRLTSSGSGITGTTLGASGGSETHTLTTAQMPAHTHNVPLGYATTGTPQTIDTSGYAGANTVATSSAGSGNAHQNTQPTLVLNKIIKL